MNYSRAGGGFASRRCAPTVFSSNENPSRPDQRSNRHLGPFPPSSAGGLEASSDRSPLLGPATAGLISKVNIVAEEIARLDRRSSQSPQISRALAQMADIRAGRVSCLGCGQPATGLTGSAPRCLGCAALNGTELRARRVARFAGERRMAKADQIAWENGL